MTTEGRLAAASDPNTPFPCLVELADDEDDEVRLAVAWNPSAPPRALVHLAVDRCSSVADRARLVVIGQLATAKGRRLYLSESVESLTTNYPALAERLFSDEADDDSLHM